MEFRSSSSRPWQPTITRFPSLLCLFMFTITLIALTELAVQKLPSHKSDNVVLNELQNKAKELEKTHSHFDRKRGAAAQIDFLTQSFGDAPATTTSFLDVGTEGLLPLGPESTGTSTVIDSAFLPLSSTPETAPGTVPPSAFLPLDGGTSSTLVPLPTASAYLPIAPPTDSPVPPHVTQSASAASSAFLPIEPTAAGSAFLPVGPSAAGSALPPEQRSTVVSAAVPSAYLPVASPTDSPGSEGNPAPSGYLPVSSDESAKSTIPQSALPPPTPSTVIDSALPSSALLPLVSDTVTKPAASSDVVPIIPVTTSNSPTTSSCYRTGTIKGESYTVCQSGKVLMGGSTFFTGTPTLATLSDGNIIEVEPTGAVSIKVPQETTEQPQKWIAPRKYVLGAFVPTILAVLFTIPWHILASAIKEIEPYYQLQHPHGATVSKSLNLDYRSSINVVAVFHALRNGHFIVWWSGLVSLVTLVLAPLAPETVFIGFQGHCTATTGRQCYPKLSVYPEAARAVEGILAFVAIITVLLAFFLWRRSSGVYGNPLSLAGVATHFQNWDAIEEFRGLNPDLSSKQIAKVLASSRYRIGPYVERDGTHAYGLMPLHLTSTTYMQAAETSFRDGKKYASVSVNAVDEDPKPRQARKLSSAVMVVHPVTIIVYGILVAGLLTLIVYYNQTGGDTGFERFMDSTSFGVTALFTSIGVVIKMYWSFLDDHLRADEPYRALLAHGARAEESILLSPPSNPFTGIFSSLKHKHWFNAYISLVAILCEPLIVALANIPYKPALAQIAYRTATYTIIGVLSLMLIGIVIFLIRSRQASHHSHQWHKQRRRWRPETIAEMMLLLCGSNMLGDFRDLSELSGRERDATIRGWGKAYSIGDVVGGDGVMRWGVDEEMFVRRED